jgi:hypothetical protein
VTIEELEELIQQVVQESAKTAVLPCDHDKDENCLRKIRHYGVPFDRQAANLCAACAVCYHAAMARNALIAFRRGCLP